LHNEKNYKNLTIFAFFFTFATKINADRMKGNIKHIKNKIKNKKKKAIKV
jgi:hypothetical protein